MKSSISTISIISIVLADIYAWKAKICEHTYFQGKCGDIENKGCHNLDNLSWCESGTSYNNVFPTSYTTCDKYVYDNVSSINTKGTCLILYEKKDCSGDFFKVRPSSSYHHNLAVESDNFNDKASSIGEC